MRAKEFLRLINEAVATSIQSDLDVISQAATTDPKIAKTVNAGLNSIIAFAKNAMGNNIDQPIQEDPTTDATIDQLEKLIEQLKGQPVIVSQIKAQVEELRKQVVDAERSAGQQGFAQGAASVFDAKKASAEFKALIANVKQLPTNLQSLVVKALTGLVIENNEMFDTIKQFLAQCATEERYLDLPGLIESQSAGVVTNDPAILPIAKTLASVMPQGKRSATGKGEILLIMMGVGASEPPVGDMAVNINGVNEIIEVKASDSETDWTLTTNAMDVEASRKILVDTINKFKKRTVFLDAPAKMTQEIGGIAVKGISGISKDTLPILNPIFQEMGAAATQQMFLKMILAAAGKDSAEIAQPVVDTITDQGIDPAVMLPALRKFQFDWYQLKNKHYALLTINVNTLGFSIAKTSDKFMQDPAISATKVFDFRKNPGAIITFKQK